MRQWHSRLRKKKKNKRRGKSESSWQMTLSYTMNSCRSKQAKRVLSYLTITLHMKILWIKLTASSICSKASSGKRPSRLSRFNWARCTSRTSITLKNSSTRPTSQRTTSQQSATKQSRYSLIKSRHRRTPLAWPKISSTSITIYRKWSKRLLRSWRRRCSRKSSANTV